MQTHKTKPQVSPQTHLVFLIGDDRTVDLVLPDAGRRDGPGEAHLAVVIVRVLVDEGGAGLELAGGGGGDLAGRPEDKVLHLLRTEVAGLHAQDEGDGVHEVGLAGSVGTDDAGEVMEGPDPLQAGVGLEVLELEVGDRHGCLFIVTVGCGRGVELPGRRDIKITGGSSDAAICGGVGRGGVGYPDVFVLFGGNAPGARRIESNRTKRTTNIPIRRGSSNRMRRVDGLGARLSGGARADSLIVLASTAASSQAVQKASNEKMAAKPEQMLLLFDTFGNPF